MNNNRVLLIAYDFPPMKVSSSVQRNLKFAQYLGDFGWQAAVLTIRPGAYSRTSDSQLSEIPEDVRVERAWGLNAAKHLAIAGRYSLLTALPDRWSSWWFGGMHTGKRLIREFQPDILWSTYPIATAHMIGMGLKRRFGLPWIAECQDPMTLEGYPSNALHRRTATAVERRMVERSDRLVFVTQGALNAYRERYPEANHSDWSVISNGYDENNFQKSLQQHQLSLNTVDKPEDTAPSSKVTLLHSGVIYTDGRDPTALFDALVELRDSGHINADNLEVALRATGHDDIFGKLIAERKLQDIVKLKPLISYEKALAEMLAADALLLLQGRIFNMQIPAKIYEYLRAERPIFALADPAGDTARLLNELGEANLANISDKDDIKQQLGKLLPRLREHTLTLPTQTAVRQYSRYALTERFARLLDDVKQRGH